MTQPSEVLYSGLKQNPKEIIEWAKREIKEYENLIKLIEKENEQTKTTNKRRGNKKIRS